MPSTFDSPTRPTSHDGAPVALVTGSARRLGREIAWRLARDGYDIAIHAHHVDGDAHELSTALQAMGRRCCVVQADFTDEAATLAVVPQVIASLGRLDCVVHNASMFSYDNIDSLTYASLQAHTCANAGSAVLLARGLHAHLVEAQRSGSLVLLLDQRLWNPNPDYLAYAMSKSALELLTRLLARALAPQMRVVGVAPGLTLGSALIDEDKLARMSALSLTGRTTQPEEVADAVAMAANNAAFTGSTLMVDAGYHLRSMDRDFPFL